MSRDIKFRAFDERRKKFYDMSSFYVYVGELQNFNQESPHSHLSQFIELTDRNKVGIWEGDILVWHNNRDIIGTIVWDKEDAAFTLKFKSGDGAFLNEIYLSNFIVIGNIYETPELLNN